MSYGGNQGREPSEDTSPEPSAFRMLRNGLALLLATMLAAHCVGVLS